ncbi:hypothetical protein GCM10022263_19280 [Nocardioides daeguensis]|uniref:Glycosyltransferase n=2 Tax=Nocardioides daeguensis TaxID=908359 RepID=A0ABP6V9F7_9ACTN
MTRAALAVVDRVDPDHLHAEYLQPAELVMRAKRPFTITLHDLTAEFMRSKRAWSRTPQESVYRLIEQLRAERVESQVTRRARGVFVLSEADQQLLASSGVDSTVLRLGTTIPSSPWTLAESDPNQVCFMGALWREPNQVAARWLVERVMPKVWGSAPNAHLVIAGARPPRAMVEEFRDHPRVRIEADVPDPVHVYRASRVVMAPTLAPAGILLKAVSALALGAPVVLNNASAAAFEPDMRARMLVGESAEDFARCVIDLLTDPQEARRAGEIGQAFIESRFSWSSYAREMSGVILR